MGVCVCVDGMWKNETESPEERRRTIARESGVE
jgi:hypothetical protein